LRGRRRGEEAAYAKGSVSDADEGEEGFGKRGGGDFGVDV